MRRIFLNVIGVVIILCVLVGCIREVIKEDKVLDSQEEISRELIFDTETMDYTKSTYAMTLSSQIEYNRNYSFITRYHMYPNLAVSLGSSLAGMGVFYLVGNQMINTGKVILGQTVQWGGIIGVPAAFIGIYLGLSQVEFKKTEPINTTEVEIVPLVNQHITVSGPAGTTWTGKTSSNGLLRVPWDFLERAANSTTSSTVTLSFTASTIPTPVTLPVSRSRVLSVSQKRSQASNLINEARRDMNSGRFYSAQTKLEQVEELVPGSDLASEASKIEKEDLVAASRKAGLQVADTKLAAKVGDLLSFFEVASVLYLVDNVAPGRAMAIMGQILGYSGTEGYAAYHQLSSWQKLFVIMCFADLPAKGHSFAEKWFIRGNMYSEFLMWPDDIASKLGRIDPMSILE